MADFVTGKIIRRAEELGQQLLGDADAAASASSAADVFDDVAVSSLEREAARRGGDELAAAASNERTRRYVLAAGSVVSASFLKEFAKICGKAGAAGAIVDGAVGGFEAVGHWRDGAIDGTQVAKHVGAEAGCGFVTSASGTAGTIAVFMVTGSMGPAALAAGMGASMGSRYLYRQAVGETLPSDEELERRRRDDFRDEPAREGTESTESTDSAVEDIGNPFADDESDREASGPTSDDESGPERRGPAPPEDVGSQPNEPTSDGPSERNASPDRNEEDGDGTTRTDDADNDADDADADDGPDGFETIGPDD